MPGYFPKGRGWPSIAKTTPGVIRGTVHKHLDRYMPSMQEAVLSQLRTLDFKDEGKLAAGVCCFSGIPKLEMLTRSVIGSSVQRWLLRLCILHCGSEW